MFNSFFPLLLFSSIALSSLIFPFLLPFIRKKAPDFSPSFDLSRVVRPSVKFSDFGMLFHLPLTNKLSKYNMVSKEVM